MNRTIFILFVTFIFILISLESYALDAKKELKDLSKKPLLDTNWGLKKIDVEKAIEIQKEISATKRKIIVAVIDTGTDISHPALKNNIWVNKKEIPNNGIDDDKNGFIDDVNGWNFVTNDNSPKDSHGHGTHIAGIIVSSAPDVELMILKYFDPKSLSDKNLINTVKAIDYAVQNGAHIINYSGGGFGQNPDEDAAIKRAKDKNVLFVAAAGNDTEDSDKKSFYPASYDHSNIISVASLTEESHLVESSNYGVKTIDLAAPGKNIYSTLPNNRYGNMTGTSQATAFVTGALAMYMESSLENQTPEKLIEYIVMTGNFEEELKGKTKYKTKLNSYRALSMKGRDLNALGLSIKNISDNNSDIFSSDSMLIESGIENLVQKINGKNKTRIPAQQLN